YSGDRQRVPEVVSSHNDHPPAAVLSAFDVLPYIDPAALPGSYLHLGRVPYQAQVQAVSAWRFMGNRSAALSNACLHRRFLLYREGAERRGSLRVVRVHCLAAMDLLCHIADQCNPWNSHIFPPSN